MKKPLLAFLLLLTECSPQAPQDRPANSAGPATELPLNVLAPERAGGLSEDRSPISKGPIDPKSPPEAARVLQLYFAYIEARRYLDAYELWSDVGRATGESAAQFAQSFDAFQEFHADVGAPGEPQGGAGSIYIEFPVELHGRMKDGKEFTSVGTMILRRVNDVPGSTAEQRQWRIYNSEFSNARPRSS